MTKAQIKKELTAMENRAVISLVMDLYDAYPDVRENLENRFSNDEESRALLLEKYKRIITVRLCPIFLSMGFKMNSKTGWKIVCA